MGLHWAVLVVGLEALAAETVDPPAEVARAGPEWTLGVQARGVLSLAGQTTAVEARGAFALGFEARVEVGRLLVSAGVGWLGPTPWCGAPELCVGGPLLHASAAALLDPAAPTAVSLGGGLEPRLHLGSGTVGLVPFLEVAVLFWRHGATRLTVDARAGQNVLPVPVPSELVRWVNVYPTELSLGATVGW